MGSAPSKQDGDGNYHVRERVGVQEAWRRDPQELVPRSRGLERRRSRSRPRDRGEVSFPLPSMAVSLGENRTMGRAIIPARLSVTQKVQQGCYESNPDQDSDHDAGNSPSGEARTLLCEIICQGKKREE